MSRGDFGYGSTVQPYSDTPTAGRTDASRPHGRTNAEYSRLVDEISSNIFTINNNATTLERASKLVGTVKDSSELRDKLHRTEQGTNKTIGENTRLLKRLSAVCSGDKLRVLQFERLAGEFKETIQRYNTLQKTVAAKAKSAIRLSSPIKSRAEVLVDLQDDGHEEEDGLLAEDRRQQQLQEETDVIATDIALLEEREERIGQLEADILDINEIFRDLGTLVHEQGETIDTIEANVERAHDQVEGGNAELNQAAKYQRRARKKMCLIVGILLVIVAIIAIILAIKFS